MSSCPVMSSKYCLIIGIFYLWLWQWFKLLYSDGPWACWGMFWFSYPTGCRAIYNLLYSACLLVVNIFVNHHILYKVSSLIRMMVERFITLCVWRKVLREKFATTYMEQKKSIMLFKDLLHVNYYNFEQVNGSRNELLCTL